MKVWSIFPVVMLLGGAAGAQTEPIEKGAAYQEFTVYYEGVEKTQVTRVAVTALRHDLGGADEEKRIDSFYQRPAGEGVLVLGISKADLRGMEEIAFSLSDACGAHFIHKVGSSWDSVLAVAVEAGTCKTKNIPPHTLPNPPSGDITSTSWDPNDSGYNDQRNAAVESLLAQIGVQDDVILALCSEPCPKPKACLASNITSSLTDGVDKSEENDPNVAGEKRWRVKILSPGKKDGWDGQVYCACLTTTNQS